MKSSQSHLPTSPRVQSHDPRKSETGHYAHGAHISHGNENPRGIAVELNISHRRRLWLESLLGQPFAANWTFRPLSGLRTIWDLGLILCIFYTCMGVLIPCCQPTLWAAFL